MQRMSSWLAATALIGIGFLLGSALGPTVQPAGSGSVAWTSVAASGMEVVQTVQCGEGSIGPNVDHVFYFVTDKPGNHLITTFSGLDVKMDLFAQAKGKWMLIKTDDDSGDRRDALIYHWLAAGTFRVRIYPFDHKHQGPVTFAVIRLDAYGG